MANPNSSLYPYNLIALIQVNLVPENSPPGTPPSNISWGTGTIVGRNDILTASHVVEVSGYKAVDVNIFPAYDGSNPPSNFKGQWFNGQDLSGYDLKGTGAWHIDYSRKIDQQPNIIGGESISDSDAAWDLALIGISDPIGDRTGSLRMNSYQGSGDYTLLGYTGGVGHPLAAESGQVNLSLSSFSTGLYNILGLNHDHGASGGPILNASNEVVGVVSTRSVANRIDDEYRDLLPKWMSDNDSLISPPTTGNKSPQITQVETFKEGGLVYFRLHYTDPDNDALGFGFHGIKGAGWASEQHPFTDPSYGRWAPGQMQIEYPFNLASGTASAYESDVAAYVFDAAGNRSAEVDIHLIP